MLVGTWRVKDGEEAYNSVRWALDAGYRHIDTATHENESSIGKAIQKIQGLNVKILLQQNGE